MRITKCVDNMQPGWGKQGGDRSSSFLSRGVGNSSPRSFIPF